MNPACCHNTLARSPERGSLKMAASALPCLIAILLPKCPLCIAAWITAATGVALPAAVVSSIRPSLWIVCLVSAALLVRRAIRRLSIGTRLLS